MVILLFGVLSYAFTPMSKLIWELSFFSVCYGLALFCSAILSDFGVSEISC